MTWFDRILPSKPVEPTNRAEPIGDDRDMLQVVDFRGYDDVEHITFKFDSGDYYIDDSGERPRFQRKGKRSKSEGET